MYVGEREITFQPCLTKTTGGMVMKLQFHLGLAKATSGMVKNPSAYAFQTKMSSKVATDSAVFGTHAIFERNRLGLGRGGFLEIEQGKQGPWL